MLVSYALVIGAKPNGLLRRMVSAISSVLAQFGGVMLAFAFIATIGINGIGTMLIKTLTGYTVNPNWLSSLLDLVTIYCYFQIPLMIIIFLPAVDSIRPQWREACESLGGNTFQYWTRVACPILAPRFISAFLLLFASAFSAYATAAALFSQRSILVPLMIQGAMRNELDPNQQGFAQVLAFAMIIVVAIVMLLSHAVVLGEYTVASLLGRMNLQVALYQLGQSNSQISTAMSLLALLFGAVLLVALDLISDAMRKSREGK